MEDENKKVEDKTEEKKDDVTREINLDDLYDGAVNNTVIIDPVSNNEILMSNKKPNYILIGIMLSIFILLALYYIYNKTNLINKAGEVQNKPTTAAVTTKKVTDKGTLICNYSSKSDAESQDVSFNANYISDKITNTTFAFNATSNTETKSAVIENLQSQYETLYLNNVTVNGNSIDFIKNSSGFTITIETDYNKDGYDGINMSEGQTVLYVKPSKEDTIENLRKSYEDKGFTCSISYEEGNNE